MNILFINTVDTRGGAAKVAYALKKEMQARGHKTSIAVGWKYSEDNDVFVIKQRSKLRQKILRKMTYFLANDIDIVCAKKLLQTPEYRAADIIHCHNLHSNFFNLGLLRRISEEKPVVWTFHDMWPITSHCGYALGEDLQNGFFQCPSLDAYQPIAWHNEKYLEFRKRKIYEKSNFHITTPSRWLMEKVQESILKSKPISLIYNGIDTSLFKPLTPRETRQTLGLPQDKKIILFAAKGGQDRERKGMEYIYAAMEKFKHDQSILWVTIGGGKIDKTNQQYISIPYLSDQKMLAQYYTASDMFLFPSMADNCPLVVLEAQASGLPVVSFATGGIPELIDHRKTGYIAHYKDIDDLTAGIQWILNRSAQEYLALRQAVTEKIRSGFTLKKMTDQYIKLYEKLLKTWH